ncbi:MAG TPA: hypothetical protein V6D47_13285 [Oscillatoriaceae cyanobacterium]
MNIVLAQSYVPAARAMAVAPTKRSNRTLQASAAAKRGPAPGLAQLGRQAAQQWGHGTRQLVQVVKERLSAAAWRCHELCQYGAQTPETLSALALHRSGAGVQAVNELFAKLLGRPPQAMEQRAWLAALGSGAPLSQLAAKMAELPEAQVNVACRKTFGRPMPDTARHFYMRRVARGESPEALVRWMGTYRAYLAGPQRGGY